MAGLATLAKDAGYEVSGSDIQITQNFGLLKSRGITDINVGQASEQIAETNRKKPIDWFVYSSALNSVKDHPELEFCKANDIKISKRDELINQIISDKNLKLVAIAGTHGKTTTTAMTIWALKQLGLQTTYLVGATLSSGDMGAYEPESEYFIYECDEFDRNFLAYSPFFSIISGVGYDHHEIYPTREDYNQSFRQFLNQSQRAILWNSDADKLGLDRKNDKYTLEDEANPAVEDVTLTGLYNRRDGWLVVNAVSQITGATVSAVTDAINDFPGVGRRFEKISNNLYSDDAHTPEKIVGCMSVARETAKKNGIQKIVVIYEPLTNRRMHYLAKDHHSVFDGADKIYWLPSYLAREDPSLSILSPEQLIQNLSPSLRSVAEPADKNNELKAKISHHLQSGDLVVAMAGGGGGSLDEWLRQEFLDQSPST